MIEHTSVPQFGERKEGVDYQFRPGGYVIACNETGHVAVVRSKGDHHLPGGGLEAGETSEDAAVREAFEECRLRVNVANEVGVADEFLYVEKKDRYFQKRCHFFEVELIAREGEGDHELVWLTPEDAQLKLKHECHKWAVGKWTAENGKR